MSNLFQSAATSQPEYTSNIITKRSFDTDAKINYKNYHSSGDDVLSSVSNRDDCTSSATASVEVTCEKPMVSIKQRQQPSSSSIQDVLKIEEATYPVTVKDMTPTSHPRIAWRKSNGHNFSDFPEQEGIQKVFLENEGSLHSSGNSISPNIVVVEPAKSKLDRFELNTKTENSIKRQTESSSRLNWKSDQHPGIQPKGNNLPSISFDPAVVASK